MLAQQLQEIPCSGLGRLPSASAAKDVLQLLHAGHSCTKAVELVLQAGVLAPDLLIEGDDRHARPPQGAFITPSLVLVHDGQLPEISKQNHAGQALSRTPHSQDAVKLRCSQHGDLVQNNEVVLGEDAKRFGQVAVEEQAAVNGVDVDVRVLGAHGRGQLTGGQHE